jgi:ProP effector
MTIPAPTISPFQAARTLLSEMQIRFEVFREFKPLAIGIDKQLFAQMPNLDKKTLRFALSMHTSSVRYLKAMEKATSRSNLDDTPASEVDETHRKHASDILRERFKKSMQQKKANEEAEKAERQRVEKLQQLTERFSPRR